MATLLENLKNALSNNDAKAAVSLLKEVAVQIEADRKLQVEFGKSSASTLCAALSVNKELDVLENVLWVIARLFRRTFLDKSTICLENIALCVELGFCDAVVNIVNEHFENTGGRLMEVCCLCIMMLAGDCEERQLSIGTLEFCTNLANILPIHLESYQTLDFTCRAIRNLSHHSEVAAIMIQAGAAKALSIVINAYFSSEGTASSESDAKIVSCPLSEQCVVLEACAWALVNLSSESETATVIGSQGGCDAAVSLTSFSLSIISTISKDGKCSGTLDRFDPRVTRLMIASLCALRNMTVSSALNYSILKHTKCCQVALDALVSYCPKQILTARVVEQELDLTMWEILEYGMWSVSNICMDNDMAQTLGVELGGCRVITDIFSFKHPLHASLDGESKTTSGEAGGLTGPPSVLAPGPVLEAGIWAVRNLSNTSPELQTMLCTDCNICELLTRTLSTHEALPTMTESTCGTIVNVAYLNTQCILAFNEAGICKSLYSALKIHAEDSDVLEYGLRALIILCGGGGHLPSAAADADASTASSGDADVSSSPEETVAVAASEMDPVTCSGATLNKSQWESLGMLSLILTYFEHHFQDPNILRLCCEFLLVTHYTTSHPHRQRLQSEFEVIDEKGHAIVKDSFSAVLRVWDIAGLKEYLGEELSELFQVAISMPPRKPESDASNTSAATSENAAVVAMEGEEDVAGESVTDDAM